MHSTLSPETHTLTRIAVETFHETSLKRITNHKKNPAEQLSGGHIIHCALSIINCKGTAFQAGEGGVLRGPRALPPGYYRCALYSLPGWILCVVNAFKKTPAERLSGGHIIHYPLSIVMCTQKVGQKVNFLYAFPGISRDLFPVSILSSACYNTQCTSQAPFCIRQRN